MKFAVFLVVLASLFVGCSSRPTDPVFGTVPEFQLTAQTGQPFDSKILKGNIWVADFIFTTCPGPCPRMTSQMHQVQEATSKMPDVKFVSFTVDPARDTPEQLALYAKAHHATPDRWYFLTGTEASLNHLGLDVFKLNRVDEKLQHSTRFALVDKNAQIRAYYETSEPDSIPKLVADIHRLAKEQN
jgi:protein SCO1/2